ncbi:MAG TPA: hypothetical protein VIC26_00840 [Marinagarivorans sp.]
MHKGLKIAAVVLSVGALFGCDRINNASRTMDTMLGGDYDVYIQGHPVVYRVNNGKVTSVPEKGYYVFYAVIDGEKRMVQSPIHATTIVARD